MNSTVITKRRLALLAIFIAAVGLRLWRIDSLPPGFHFDESFEGLEAWRMMTDAAYRPLFLTGNFGVPPLNSYVNALTFRLFLLMGALPGPTAMRVTAAVLGVSGVVALYGLANELRRHDGSMQMLSVAFPLFAAATLAVMRWHVHFSRMGIEPIFVPLIWATATAFLLHGWRTERWLSFAGSGVVLGLGMYTYRGAWVIPLIFVLLGAYLLIHGGRKGRITGRQAGGIVLCAALALIVFAPLGLLFWQTPQLVLLRLNQLAIVGDTGSPADNSVWNSLWAMSKMFGPFGTPGDIDPRRNLPGTPALNVWLALPFYWGLVISMWRIRHTAYVVGILGLLGLLSVNVVSEYAPHFHRVLGGAAPAALLCAVGLDRLWQWPLLRRFHLHWMAVLLLFVGAGVDARDYFVRWANLPDLFYAFDVGLWKIGQDMAAQPAEVPIYITPRALDHPTLAFAWETQSEREDRPVSFDGRHIFPVTDGASLQPELYIAIEHEDFRTPLLLPGVLPAAQVQKEVLDTTGQVYARSYVRPADTVVARPPQQERHEVVGDGVTLLGYDVQPADLHRGEILYLQLHWLVEAAPTANWTVFTHVITTDPAGNAKLVAGRDSIPGAGSLPTIRWRSGWRILDEYQILLPGDLPAGEYRLEIGLYQPTGEQLPSGGIVVLGSVEVE